MKIRFQGVRPFCVRIVLSFGILSVSLAQAIGLTTEAATCAPAVSEKPPTGLIAIADPVDDENLFAPALRQRGLLPLYLKSDQKRHKARRSVLSGFHREFSATVLERLESGVFEQALRGLREVQEASPLPLVHVVSEGASGMFFGERLSAALRLPGHDAHILSGLSTRTEMFSRVATYLKKKHSKVRIMPTFVSEDPGKAKDWVKYDLDGWRITDGIIVTTEQNYSGNPEILVRNERELDTAIREILGSGNPMGGTNSKIMLMPFIEGEEYSVNGAILRNGSAFPHIRFSSVVHHIRPDKTDSGHEVLLTWHEIPTGLLEAEKLVLEGLAYGMGPFRGRYKITQEGQIFFIENAQRFHGHGHTGLISACTDYGQIEAAADVYGDEAAFLAKAGRPYESTHRGVVVSIEVPRTDRALRANHALLNRVERKLKEDGFLYKMDRFADDGEVLEPSNGRLTTMAQIEIRVPMDIPNREIAIRGYLAWIQQLEASGKFFK